MSTTDSLAPIDRDIAEFESSLHPLLKEPTSAAKLDENDFVDLLRYCVGRIRRLRMGGRSLPLFSLGVLLWHRDSDSLAQADIDVEELLADALKICRDPSYVQPEWALVVVGALLARHASLIPDEVRDEALQQCRIMLCFLEQPGRSVEAVAMASRTLINCWDEGFSNGLQPVVDACLKAWQDPSEVRGISKGRLKELIVAMNDHLPETLSDRDRDLYRRYRELSGSWQLLERIRFE